MTVPSAALASLGARRNVMGDPTTSAALASLGVGQRLATAALPALGVSERLATASLPSAAARNHLAPNRLGTRAFSDAAGAIGTRAFSDAAAGAIGTRAFSDAAAGAIGTRAFSDAATLASRGFIGSRAAQSMLDAQIRDGARIDRMIRQQTIGQQALVRDLERALYPHHRVETVLGWSRRHGVDGTPSSLMRAFDAAVVGVPRRDLAALPHALGVNPSRTTRAAAARLQPVATEAIEAYADTPFEVRPRVVERASAGDDGALLVMQTLVALVERQTTAAERQAELTEQLLNVPAQRAPRDPLVLSLMVFSALVGVLGFVQYDRVSAAVEALLDELSRWPPF